MKVTYQEPEFRIIMFKAETTYCTSVGYFNDNTDPDNNVTAPVDWG